MLFAQTVKLTNSVVDFYMNLKPMLQETETPEELGEEEAAASSSGAKPAYPTVTKWESGVARTGPANQIGLTKWRDIVKINRGKANTLL
jgi:hypothetical protein